MSSLRIPLQNQVLARTLLEISKSLFVRNIGTGFPVVQEEV